ncbi:MAG TPA: DUF4465 domain-containing protein [Saprospiraceae bacterium]|nr:DUF4465 domain-containing protein [Saprospiraceae bacterium]
MKFTFTLLISILQIYAYSQVIAGFENFKLGAGEYLNDASPAAGFESGSIILPNDYNDKFDFWSGFAISADTNTTTPGFLNQYSAYPGKGAVGSTTYAMGYIYQPTIINLKEKAIGKPMIGMYVANSTYSYLSMRDGDAFAKKFGGETGTDPDFFLLTIKKYSGGVISDDSLRVYLADYRSSNPNNDYILSDWKYVDLTILGEVDSLILQLSSSDVGSFGMNTPSYVAIDEVSTDNLLAAFALNDTNKPMIVGPNPARESLYLDIPQSGRYSLTSIYGTVIWAQDLEAGRHEISVAEFPKGIYFVSRNGHMAFKVCLQ